MIESLSHPRKDLTVHACRGSVSLDDLRNAIRALYDGEATPHHLWDLREADVGDLMGADLRSLAGFAKAYAPDRVGGRTAIVSDVDVIFGLGRAYEAVAGMSGPSAEVRAFRRYDDALAWIEGAPPCDSAGGPSLPASRRSD